METTLVGDKLASGIHGECLVRKPPYAFFTVIGENALGEGEVVHIRIFEDDGDWRKRPRFLREANDVEVNAELQGTTPLLLPRQKTALEILCQECRSSLSGIMKTMIVVSNWKANVNTREDARKLFATAKRLASVKRVKLVLAPSTPHLGLLAPGNRSKVGFAAQDLSDTTVGAATGEVVGQVLRNIGVGYVLLGHSERRAKGETDALVAEKARRALANGLIPIICIGESARDEDAQYLSFLKDQIASVYGALSPKERLSVIVAYEPVWAIGKSASDAMGGAELAEMALYIKKVLADYFPGKVPTKVLYGGSVDASNIRDIAGGSRIDGFLVGRASTDPKSLTALVKALA